MTTELSNPHDRFFKEVWSRKAIVRDFLRCYLPRGVVAMLDLKALELIKESFVDPQLREYHSDLLYRLRLKNGEPALAYVLGAQTPSKTVDTAATAWSHRVPVAAGG